MMTNDTVYDVIDTMPIVTSVEQSDPKLVRDVVSLSNLSFERDNIIIILHVLRAIRDFFARGHNDVRTDGEARGRCVIVPEGKKIFYYMLLLHAFMW